MKGGRSASGYTVVEIMIFLAISGLLFLMAMFTIGRQEQKSEFAQGVRDFQASLDDVINDVRNGNYPTQDYTCTADGTAGHAPTFASGPNTQGSNDKCIFLGKTIQFSRDENAQRVFTLAGRRYVTGSSSRDVKTYSESAPAVSATSGLMLESFKMSGGVTVSGVINRVNGSTLNTWAVSILSSLTDTAANGASTNNNLQVVSPVRSSNGSGFDSMDEALARTTINSNHDTSTPPVYDYDNDSKYHEITVICLHQGTNGKKAAIFIGAGGGGTNTEIHIEDVDTIVPAKTGGEVCPA